MLLKLVEFRLVLGGRMRCRKEGRRVSTKIPFLSQSPDCTQRPNSSELLAFSKSIKSKFSAASARYKDSISKGTQGFREKLLARNSSVKELSKGVQREMTSSIAGVARMIERLDLKSKRNMQSGEVCHDGETSNFFSKGKGVLDNITASSRENRVVTGGDLNLHKISQATCSITSHKDVSCAEDFDMMASSLNCLTVGDQIPDNLLDSPARPDSIFYSRPRSCWRIPPPFWRKLNTYGGLTSYGYCIWGSDGELAVFGVMWEPLQAVFGRSKEYIEAEALNYGLQKALRFGYKKLIAECSCLLLLTKIRDRTTNCRSCY
ncbi:hypothetical protein SOVF_147810 isoform D [Spinacia oleracea]|nr:hypothetical protein SOVF_147810 isoform D [Spinacia oleracea]